MRSGPVVATVLALLAVLVAAGACLAFPLTSNPGPESAQILGIVGGIGLCLSQAARGAGRAQTGFAADAIAGLLVAGAMLGLFIVATTIGGALRPSCGEERGYLPFLFLAVPVLVLQGAVGTWVGRLVGRAGMAVFAALIVEIVVAGWLFSRWYQAPGFRVTSHFFVVVAADLLRGAGMSAVIVGYRAATLAFGVGAVLAGAGRWPRIRRVGLSTQKFSSPVLYAAAGASFILGLTAHALTVEQIAPRREAMEARYTLAKKRGLLVVHADPLAVRPRDVDGVLAEGTLWLDRLSLRLGQKPQGEVHIWLHATREDQAHWTGAQHVDFTLPWRREIHIAGAEVPHDTLGHELAHAVAGELSDNLLRIPTDLVFFQHAAVVEGLAVALTPELSMRDGLTVKEQAAAMKKLGLAPPTTTLFAGVSFFAEAPARAYVAAGAFIESLAARAPSDPTTALAALYKRGSIEDAVGSADAAAQILAFHDKLLDELPVPPDAALAASERFKRPSILRDVCEPEDVEKARALRALVRTGEGKEALAELGDDVARATLEDLLLDAHDVEDPVSARALGTRLESLDTPIDSAVRTVALGDTLWRTGRTRDAAATWDRANADLLSPALMRPLSAKRALAEDVIASGHQAPVASAALDVLLASTAAARADAFERLHYWLGVDDGGTSKERREPRGGVAVARYIHARRLGYVGALEESAQQFRRALDDKALPTALVEEARINLGTVLVKLGRGAEASELLVAAADEATRPASRLLLRDRAERAARAAAAPEAPARVTAVSDPAWADRLLLGLREDGEL